MAQATTVAEREAPKDMNMDAGAGSGFTTGALTRFFPPTASMTMKAMTLGIQIRVSYLAVCGQYMGKPFINKELLTSGGPGIHRK